MASMSSTTQATYSTSPTPSSISNTQLITNALADYAKITGIDLTNNPLATALKQSNSPEAILQLIQEREKEFKEYRDGNRRLLRCLSPAVNVIQAFSGILGEAVSLVSHETDLITLLKRTSSGTPPTSEGLVCWDRRSPRCTSLEYPLYPFPL